MSIIDISYNQVAFEEVELYGCHVTRAYVRPHVSVVYAHVSRYERAFVRAGVRAGAHACECACAYVGAYMSMHVSVCVPAYTNASPPNIATELPCVKARGRSTRHHRV